MFSCNFSDWEHDIFKRTLVLLYNVFYGISTKMSTALLLGSRKATSPKKNEKVPPASSEPTKTPEELAVYRQISQKNHDLNNLTSSQLKHICRVSKNFFLVAKLLHNLKCQPFRIVCPYNGIGEMWISRLLFNKIPNPLPSLRSGMNYKIMHFLADIKYKL